jgi:hypothetical protein
MAFTVEIISPHCGISPAQPYTARGLRRRRSRAVLRRLAAPRDPGREGGFCRSSGTLSDLLEQVLSERLGEKETVGCLLARSSVSGSKPDM